ncbi:hypothetical protein DFH06DRAFT_1357343 [Mycena polygramma]|nr:hypothetical protein DFH06DRAFT_1357343 [Mycena polygramma]
MDRTPRTTRIQNHIHTLRGEYFRHTQNQKRLPPNLKTRTYNSPTLPADLFSDSAYSKEKPRPPRDTREALFVSKRIEPQNHDLATTSTGRAEALSLILPIVAECHKVPPLTLLCLQTLTLDADFLNIIPFIPAHLRLDLLRWTAVHRPLTNHQLRALCGSDGHVAGELIIIGPNATVHEQQFRRPDAEHRAAEWESDESFALPPMHTLIIVCAHLGFSVMSTLPATLTHLALVNVPNALPLHRLPMTCPLLQCLDLSHNIWLATEKEARESLDKVQWSRWHQLRILGLKGCHIPADVLGKVNKGRWDDVRVVK